jgi:D-alanyl-D-alanine carboxypeptidase
VGHLLTHTSGLFSFQEDLKFREKKGYTAPDELVRIAERHGCIFCPGERWLYSNTGYVLLGLIVEKVEKRPFHESVQARIIDKLGLKHTIAMTPNRLPTGLAVGHVQGLPEKGFECTTPFAAGNIAASAGDVVVFWHALLSGRVLDRATIQQSFERLYPMFGQKTPCYGRGVMVYDVPNASGGASLWIGHSGGAPSAKAVVAYDVSSRAFVAVALNADVSAEACANKLLQVVREQNAVDAPASQ